MSNKELIARIDVLLLKVERMNVPVAPVEEWELLQEARDALRRLDESLSQASMLLAEKQDELDSQRRLTAFVSDFGRGGE